MPRGSLYRGIAQFVQLPEAVLVDVQAADATGLTALATIAIPDVRVTIHGLIYLGVSTIIPPQTFDVMAVDFAEGPTNANTSLVLSRTLVAATNFGTLKAFSWNVSQEGSQAMQIRFTDNNPGGAKTYRVMVRASMQPWTDIEPCEWEEAVAGFSMTTIPIKLP